MTTVASSPREQAFWDSIAPKYARKPIADLAAYEQKLQRVGALLRRSDRVLEIGCGTGSTALRLANGVASVTATDVSRAMIDIARAKLRPDAPTSDAPNNVTFLRADAREVIEAHPFDAVCAFSLLHLLSDLPAVLARVRMQLRPGGLFISKTVCLKDGSVLLRAAIPALHALGLAPKVTRLGTDELASQIEAAGFQIEEISHFGSSRLNPFIVARRTA